MDDTCEADPRLVAVLRHVPPQLRTFAETLMTALVDVVADQLVAFGEARDQDMQEHRDAINQLIAANATFEAQIAELQKQVSDASVN
jgi:hypothetical protein